MRYWGESYYLVSLKPVTSVQTLNRLELVLASLPAWAAVPRMQVQQQVNKSFPSCQGPKWGRGEEAEINKITCFLTNCVCCFRKKKIKSKDYNMTSRWKTELGHATECASRIQVLNHHCHTNWLLMLIRQEILSVNQSLMNEFLSIKMLAFCNLHINFLYTVFMIVTKPKNKAKDQDSLQTGWQN